MKVLTKDVAAGTPVEFKFDASGSRFLIKNFTRSPISCKILDAVICIPANTSQMVATRQVPQTLEDYTDTITVTAQEASKQGWRFSAWITDRAGNQRPDGLYRPVARRI